jgi:hypothetical protein
MALTERPRQENKHEHGGDAEAAGADQAGPFWSWSALLLALGIPTPVANERLLLIEANHALSTPAHTTQ